MFGFNAYYWDVAELGADDRLAVRALNQATPALPSAGYAGADPAALLRALRTLLHSDDVRARGVALDQFSYAGAQHRWTGGDPLANVDAEVLAEARAMLAAQPDPAVPLSAQPMVVSGWNSALGALIRVDDNSGADIARIVEVLDAMLAGADLLDPHNAWALEYRLAGADDAACARVRGWLTRVIGDDRVTLDARIAMIGVLRADERRLGAAEVLLPLLRHPELRLSIQAAWQLTDRGFDEPIRSAVAGWPDDAPYPAGEVRESIRNLPPGCRPPRSGQPDGHSHD